MCVCVCTCVCEGGGSGDSQLTLYNLEELYIKRGECGVDLDRTSDRET